MEIPELRARLMRSLGSHHHQKTALGRAWRWGRAEAGGPLRDSGDLTKGCGCRMERKGHFWDICGIEN